MTSPAIKPGGRLAIVAAAVPVTGASTTEMAHLLGVTYNVAAESMRTLVNRGAVVRRSERRDGRAKAERIYYPAAHAPAFPQPPAPKPPPAPRPPPPAPAPKADPRPPEATPFFGTSREPTWVSADRARRAEEEAEVERLARLLADHPGESAAALAARLGHVGPPARKGGEPRPMPSRTATRLEDLEAKGRAVPLDPPNAGYARRWRAA